MVSTFIAALFYNDIHQKERFNPILCSYLKVKNKKDYINTAFKNSTKSFLYGIRYLHAVLGLIPSKTTLI